MSRLLLLTDAPQPTTEVLPSLALLAHEVTALPASATALLSAPECDAIIVDGRGDLEAVRSLCQLIQTTGVGVPVLLVMTEGGLVTASIEWGVAEVLLATAGPAEVEARLRLGAERLTSAPEEADGRTVIR
ncbi:MAG: DNA-binding response regulator, partial [Nocardioidaceae bacterium]